MVIFWRIISLIATFGCLVAGVFTGTNNSDLISSYKADVKAVDFYENDFDDAIPQTEMYDIISKHFSSPLAEGKTVKKCIVIGYDGCRADNLVLCKDGGGIKTLLGMSEDSTSVLSYCGGVNYPYINTQDTSTAPGWCSMLTGVWADENGVSENDVHRKAGVPMLLTSLVEDDIASSSAFYVSWSGHFKDTDSTYYEDRIYCEENNLPVKMLCANDDNGTKANVLSDVKSADCSDFIFSIFEYCDHVGHDTGFCRHNSEQEATFYEAEATATEVINAITSRSTYETEDWLIIITSDHGGYNTWHGGPTMQERYTFIISNKNLGYSFSD